MFILSDQEKEKTAGPVMTQCTDAKNTAVLQTMPRYEASLLTYKHVCMYGQQIMYVVMRLDPPRSRHLCRERITSQVNRRSNKIPDCSQRKSKQEASRNIPKHSTQTTDGVP